MNGERGFLGGRGFTIIELLVAIAVLALMGTLMAGMLGGVSSASVRASAAMDAFSEARAVLNLLQRNLNSAIIRPDLPCAYSSSNHDLSFYTSEPGDERPIRYVNYTLRPASGADFPALERKVQYYSYSGSSPLEWRDPAQTTEPSVSTSGDMSLSDGICGFQCVFLDASGNQTEKFNRGDADPASATRAVRVSLFVVSERAREVLKSTNQESALATLIGTLASNTETQKQAWDRAIDGSNLQAVIRSGMRTFERVILIDGNASITENASTAP